MKHQVSDADVVVCKDLPESLDSEKVYRLIPKNPDDAYYEERTDRNIGWITREEQKMLRASVVGISGCGGMGAQLAEKLLRLGVGEIRIADCEDFDISNINRQFGATRATVGKSKAFVTARMLRSVSDDACHVVYPQGICEETVDHFLEGCDVVCDEIEFWAAGARVLLHQRARAQGIALFNCNTIGFGTRLFLFTPDGVTMEECLGIDYEEAKRLQQKVQLGTIDSAEKRRFMELLVKGLLPEFPQYAAESGASRQTSFDRLIEESRAAIIATNPPMATGFLADHILLHLLRDSGVKRDVVYPPEMPGYLFFDAARMEAKVVTERWW